MSFALLIAFSCRLTAQQPSPHRYETQFAVAEFAIFEHGKWTNGGKDGVDWCDVATTAGHAFGTESGAIKYDDSTAILTGDWGPDQTVEATVFSRNPTETAFEEVEIRLRSVIKPHLNTGYEINFRCLKTGAAYAQIVRWNGKLGDFSYVDARGGPEYGVANGDVVKASILGNRISVSINGREVLKATDDTYKSGNPGMGFYLEGPKTLNADFGFTRFSAHD